MKHCVPTSGSILEVLGKCYPDSSKTTLRSWVKEGRVYLDEQKVNYTHQTAEAGQTIELKQKVFNLAPHFHILYEDKDLVVIDKPPGLLSVATDHGTEVSAHEYLKEYFDPKRVYPVHRLDQGTSGVMLFALSEKARDKLKEVFEKHDIVREYVAIVEGRVEPTSGKWECYLYEDKRYHVHVTNDPERGQYAVTHYVREKVYKGYSLLRLKLETGRKNQIRVHCSEAGYPVAGDTKYGAETNPLSRLGLHATLIEFTHPTLGKRMRFEVPIPKRFSLFMR